MASSQQPHTPRAKRKSTANDTMAARSAETQRQALKEEKREEKRLKQEELEDRLDDEYFEAWKRTHTPDTSEDPQIYSCCGAPFPDWRNQCRCYIRPRFA